MEIGQALRIIDPETTVEVLAEIEYYAGFSGGEAKVEAVNEACRTVCEYCRKAEKVLLEAGIEL